MQSKGLSGWNFLLKPICFIRVAQYSHRLFCGYFKFWKTRDCSTTSITPLILSTHTKRALQVSFQLDIISLWAVHILPRSLSRGGWAHLSSHFSLLPDLSSFYLLIVSPLQAEMPLTPLERMLEEPGPFIEYAGIHPVPCPFNRTPGGSNEPTGPLGLFFT